MPSQPVTDEPLERLKSESQDLVIMKEVHIHRESIEEAIKDIPNAETSVWMMYSQLP